MIRAIASTQFPQSFDSHASDTASQPKPIAPPAIEAADTVQISSQARAAQASYRRVFESKKPVAD